MENSVLKNEISFTSPQLGTRVTSVIVSIFLLFILFSTLQIINLLLVFGIVALACEILLLFICLLPFIRAKTITIDPQEVKIHYKYLRDKDLIIPLEGCRGYFSYIRTHIMPGRGSMMASFYSIVLLSPTGTKIDMNGNSDKEKIDKAILILENMKIKNLNPESSQYQRKYSLL